MSDSEIKPAVKEAAADLVAAIGDLEDRTVRIDIGHTRVTVCKVNPDHPLSANPETRWGMEGRPFYPLM